MIRRFVNVVAENYKTGVYSLHRLDVSKHIFHQSRADARAAPFLAEAAQDNGAASGDEQPMLDRLQLQELPSAMTTWSSSNVDHFSLLGSPCTEEGRILCTNKVGTADLYDPHSSSNFIMPGLNGFKGGHVPVSVSVAPAGDKEEEEEQLYIMHVGPDPDGLWWTVATRSASSVAEGIETYCFDTVSCKWKHAGDWVLPFTGKAEYISDLKLWLGFSLRSPGYLCAASGLDHSDSMLMDHKPMPLIVWPDHTPKEWMAVRVELISLKI